MKDLATNNEQVAEEMNARFRNTAGVYFRFNVDQGVQIVGEGNWESLDDVVEHTKTYPNWEISELLRHAAGVIWRRGSAILTMHIGQLTRFYYLSCNPSHRTESHIKIDRYRHACFGRNSRPRTVLHPRHCLPVAKAK